jgi:Helix-turn-helix domain
VFSQISLHLRNTFVTIESAVDNTANTLKENFMINMETKTGKAYKALVLNGEKLTASEAKKRFGIGNLSAEATRLRQAGFAIYANKRVAGNGVTVTEYRHGKPSRALIAAGYRAMALGLV